MVLHDQICQAGSRTSLEAFQILAETSAEARLHQQQILHCSYIYSGSGTSASPCILHAFLKARQGMQFCILRPNHRPQRSVLLENAQCAT